MSPLLTREPESTVPAAAGATGPDQGVIEEARRRQRRRRIRIAVATLVAAALTGVIVWALSGGASRASPTHAGAANRTRALDVSGAHVPAFNVRLVPMLNFVGVAGWCEVYEENGITGGSACGGVPASAQPFLQISTSGEAKTPDETQVAVTAPQITAILVDGHRRVQTAPLPGLPYGLRGARVVTRVGATLAALDTNGNRVPQVWSQPPRQATVRGWRYPQRPPSGTCQLQVGRVPGLAVRGGAVATSIRPFPGQLVGHAFLPCAATEYVMRGVPLKAIILLDAAEPTSRAADLPSFHPVRRAPGMFAGGDLTAMRSGNAWLVAEQGSGSVQRMRLLRHLTATIRL
jgi:hypothetical protein